MKAAEMIEKLASQDSCNSELMALMRAENFLEARELDAVMSGNEEVAKGFRWVRFLILRATTDLETLREEG